MTEQRRLQKQEAVLVCHSNEVVLRHLSEPTPVNTSAAHASASLNAVPDYLSKVYHWSYLHPRNVPWLDNERIVKLILWWQHNALRQAAFHEIKAGDSVLQAAAVYGQFSVELAKLLGSSGSLDLIDVAPIQVSLTREKLNGQNNARVHLADASSYDQGHFDVVLSYFLLHEVPDDYKTKILDNLLQRVKPGGKLVIVDYHKPFWAHPLKPVMSLVFDFLEPFAKSFWRHPVQHFCTHADDYHWQHEAFFGGLYQKVTVTRR